MLFACLGKDREKIAAKIAIMAMTTSSSMRVKPECDGRDVVRWAGARRAPRKKSGIHDLKPS